MFVIFIKETIYKDSPYKSIIPKILNIDYKSIIPNFQYFKKNWHYIDFMKNIKNSSTKRGVYIEDKISFRPI